MTESLNGLAQALRCHRMKCTLISRSHENSERCPYIILKDEERNLEKHKETSKLNKKKEDKTK